MNIYDADVVKVISGFVDTVHSNYSVIIKQMDNNVNSYISASNDPYVFNMGLNELGDFVLENYVDLVGQIKIVYSSYATLQGMMDTFTKYYTTLCSLHGKLSDGSEEDISTALTLALISLVKNSNNGEVKTAAMAVLKSACTQPSIGALLQISEDIVFGM